MLLVPLLVKPLLNQSVSVLFYVSSQKGDITHTLSHTHTHMHARTCRHTHTHTHASDMGKAQRHVCEKDSLKVVIEQACLGGSLQRGRRMRVVETGRHEN